MFRRRTYLEILFYQLFIVAKMDCFDIRLMSYYESVQIFPTCLLLS